MGVSFQSWSSGAFSASLISWVIFGFEGGNNLKYYPPNRGTNLFYSKSFILMPVK